MPQRETSSDSLNKYTPKTIHNKIIIDDKKLIDYFENHTLKECGEHFSCSLITIKRKLKSLNIDTSIHNHTELAYEKSRKFSFTKDELYQYYIINNLDSKTIAEQTGCHFNVVRKWIRKYGIVKPRNDVSKSMMSRHYKKHGYAHPAQRPDVLKKTRRSAQRALYTAKSGGVYNFRSLMELSVARFLDSRNLEWEYEELTIPYVDNMTGKWRSYTIDFTVIEPNDDVIWLEVKPNNKMIPVDKRIYASRRAEDAGTIYRGLFDEERDAAFKLLKSGYRSEFYEFNRPKPRANAKYITYHFKNKIDMALMSIPGWKVHSTKKHSDKLHSVKFKKSKID